MRVTFQRDNVEQVFALTQKKEEGLLWAQFQAGDETAFARLYEMYVQVIYNYGRKITDDDVLIEDCIHGLFLDLWKSKANLSQPVSIRFYLYASLKRRILKEIARKKEQLMDDHSNLECVLKEATLSIEECLVQEQDKIQQRISLKKGLQLLSCNQRKAILLRYYRDLSFQEISGVMGMSIDNVYKLVSRGISTLKRNVRYAGV